MVYQRVTEQIELIPIGSRQLCREESDRRLEEMINAMDKHEIAVVLNAIKKRTSTPASYERPLGFEEKPSLV